MIELAKFNGKEDLKIGDIDGVFEVRKRIPGVNKAGNKWRARILHPKLKIEVHLGYYSTPEEAALVVKKKRAEFDETCKGDNCEGKKLPIGVSRRGYTRWGARIWHPRLKYHASLGSYSSPEEAAIAFKTTRAEFSKIYGKGNDNASEISDELAGDLEVPKGVRKLKSGKWIARIRDPETRTRIWLGTFNTDEEAVRSFNKASSELAAKRKVAELDGVEFRPKASSGFEANEGATKIECADYLNIASVPLKLESKFVQCSPTSVFEPKNSESVDVSDSDTSVIRLGNEQKSGCISDMEEAMSLGIINEYGQLVGDYSALDEHMEFSVPDDVVADIGYY